MLKYIIFGSIGLLVIAGIAYFILTKKMGKSEYAKIKKLQQGTKTSSFSMDVLYQKLYITFIKIPFIKRYLFKLRRRLEILNIDDEYSTRRDTANVVIIQACLPWQMRQIKSSSAHEKNAHTKHETRVCPIKKAGTICATLPIVPIKRQMAEKMSH